MKKTNKGFTLIELLVVIAIIGILSSVVLASLTTARTKGSDAAVSAALSSMRAQAELYYSSNSNYGSSTSAAVIDCSAATANSGGMFAVVSPGLKTMVAAYPAARCSALNVGSTSGFATTWAVSASTSVTGVAWCVDSSGKSATSTGISGSTGLCI